MIVRRLPSDELYHHGVKGQKWGVRRYQDYDGTYFNSKKRSFGDSVKSGYEKAHSIKKKVDKVPEKAGETIGKGIVKTYKTGRSLKKKADKVPYKTGELIGKGLVKSYKAGRSLKKKADKVPYKTGEVIGKGLVKAYDIGKRVNKKNLAAAAIFGATTGGLNMNTKLINLGMAGGAVDPHTVTRLFGKSIMKTAIAYTAITAVSDVTISYGKDYINKLRSKQ